MQLAEEETRLAAKAKADTAAKKAAKIAAAAGTVAASVAPNKAGPKGPPPKKPRIGKSTKEIPCRQFAKGECSYGDKCKFKH